MGPRALTAPTSVQLMRMAKSWATTGVRPHSEPLPKRPTPVRTKGRGHTAAVQATAKQLAVSAHTAPDPLSTGTSALGSVPTRQDARHTPR